MLGKLERQLEAQGITNIRILEAGLGEGALEREAFDRVLLAFVLGEVRDREAAVHELYAALKPGGVLSVSEGFGDPDYCGKKRPHLRGSDPRRDIGATAGTLVVYGVVRSKEGVSIDAWRSYRPAGRLSAHLPYRRS